MNFQTIRDDSLIYEIDIAKRRISALEKENGVLAVNISVLYKTAKFHLDRQDLRIKELESELKASNELVRKLRGE